MEAAADPAGDARTFKVNFTATGKELLRGRVREKLREFMSSPDDYLVDYVIVLLENGRRKDEAIKGLHIFLKDDSAVFISWLWDHLSLHLHLYVQGQEQDQEIKDAEAPKELLPLSKYDQRINGGHQDQDKETNPLHPFNPHRVRCRPCAVINSVTLFLH